MNNTFKVGDLVKLRNPDNYKHLSAEIIKRLEDETLVVSYLSVAAEHSILCSTRNDKKEWFFHSDDLELVTESVQENPPNRVLDETEIHWWVVLDKNGNRASSLSHNIAAAAATMSRSVESLLLDGYFFQKVAITTTPVFTLRGNYEQS